MAMNGLVLKARSWIARDEAARARRWHAQAATRLSEAEREERRAFEAVMRKPARRGSAVLGRARDLHGSPFWVGMPIEQLISMHGWTTGGTGTGKTFEALGLQLPILLRGHHPTVYFDMKGEFSELLLEVVLPALASTGECDDLLEQVRVVRPFDRDFIPQLRITRPEVGIAREVQAVLLTNQLQEALGDDLGGRMLRVYLKLVTLAIELDEPLVTLRRWLERPEAFVRAASRSEDPELREYARLQYARENRMSVEALAARIDTFLHLTETRLALSAPDCVSFADCLRRGVTVVDLGNPPAGAERIARFWSGILIGQLARAILSREVVDDTPQAHVVFEEFQEALGRSQVDQFVRLLSLARYKRVGLLFINQQPAQIAAASPILLKALRTNANWFAVFRSNLEDARAMAHALPVPAGGNGKAAGREELVEELTRLPDREFRLWIRRAPFRAQRVRSARLDLDELRRRAATVPEEIREHIRRGTVVVPRAELEEALSSGGSDVPSGDAVPEFLTPVAVGAEEPELPVIG